MSRIVKFTGYAFLALGILLAAGITATIGWRPFLGPRARAATNRTFERTPERLARGKYLAENVCGCMDCHSPHDWTQHENPILAGMEGSGENFPAVGLPGRVTAPNLTPDPETGLGRWSDDEIGRAIREGISRDGHALFPLMPYPHYLSLPDEDLASIVVFLRALPAVQNPLPKTAIIFPVKFLIRSVPEPLTAPVPPPDLSPPVRRGEFLVGIAVCGECHTPQEKGRPIAGMDFAGGQIFEGPWGRVASANITPDPTGIPYYDEQLFIQMMRSGYVHARRINQIMPWASYRGMTDEDLAAIFVYLKTLKPVQHRVDNMESATICRLCKQKHGLGEKN